MFRVGESKAPANEILALLQVCTYYFLRGRAIQ
jgi:hypothetical protein